MSDPEAARRTREHPASPRGSIRTTVFLVLGVTFVAFGLVFYFMVASFFNGTIGALERNQVAEDLNRTRQAIADEQTELGATARDWAVWDDTYQFMADHNQHYIDANLGSDSLQTIGADLMLLFGLDRSLEHSVEVAEGDELDPTLTAGMLPAAMFDASTPDAVGGLIATPAGPLVAAAHTILNSLGDQPSRGTLVFCRLLAGARIDKLSRLVRRDVQILPYALSSLPPEAGSLAQLWKESSLRTLPLNAGRIAGYSPLLDAAGKPVYLLRIEAPRDLWNAGRQQMTRMVTYLAVALGVIAGLGIVFVELLVLRPLARIARQVRFIGATGDFTGRVSAKGNDELSRLGSTVNKMLDALALAHERLLAAQAEVHALGGLLPICASCKKIRDDDGYWHQVEGYITTHTGTLFSHGLCPECAARLLAEAKL